MTRHCSLLIGLVLVVWGCGRNSNQAPTHPVADFESRLQAALKIEVHVKRDEVLTAVAVDAAEAGEVDIVKRAISKCTYHEAKDKAASDSAVRLARRGQGEAANEIANMISFQEARDDALKQIAESKE